MNNKQIRIAEEDKRKYPVKTYVNKEQKKQIQESAKACNLSISDYLLNLALNKPFHSVEKHLDTRELLKVNANLARVGNLLKLAITEGYGSEEVSKLREEIFKTQSELKEKIKEL